MTFPLTLFALQEGHGIEAAHEVAGEAFEPFLPGVIILLPMMGPRCILRLVCVSEPLRRCRKTS